MWKRVAFFYNVTPRRSGVIWMGKVFFSSILMRYFLIAHHVIEPKKLQKKQSEIKVENSLAGRLRDGKTAHKIVQQGKAVANAINYVHFHVVTTVKINKFREGDRSDTHFTQSI